MRFQKMYFRLFIGSLTLAAVLFGISYFAARMSGEKGRFPEVVFNAISGQVAPTIDLKEELGVDLTGVTDIIVDTRNADVRIASISEAGVPKAITEKNSAVVKLGGRVAAPMAAKDEPQPKVLQTKREGSTYEIHVNEQGPKSGITMNVDFDGTVKPLALNIFLPPEFHGRIVARTVAGDVKIRDLKISRLQISSTSGDLKAEEMQANELNAETVSGDIKVVGNFDALKLETTSGETKASWKPLSTSASSQIDIRSVSGDVKVAIPVESSFMVQMKSVSGELKTKFPGFELREGPGTKSAMGKIGSGQGSLKAVTVSGDLKLEANQHESKDKDDESAADNENQGEHSEREE